MWVMNEPPHKPVIFTGGGSRQRLLAPSKASQGQRAGKCVIADSFSRTTIILPSPKLRASRYLAASLAWRQTCPFYTFIRIVELAFCRCRKAG